MPRTGPPLLALTTVLAGLLAPVPAAARVALVADGASTLPLLDLATGKVERALLLPGPARAVAVSADGKVAAAVAGRHVVSFDLNARRELARRRLGAAPRGLAITPRGGRVLVAAGTRLLALDARSLAPGRSAALGGAAHGAVALSPSGTRAAAVLAGGRVALVAVGARLRRTARVRVPGAWGVAFTPDGRLWVSTRRGLLRVIPPGAGKPRGRAIRLGRGVGAGVAVAPGGERIAVGAARGVGRLGLVDVATRRVRGVRVGRGPGQPSWTPDGTRIYVADRTSKTVSVVSALRHRRLGSASVSARRPLQLVVQPGLARVPGTDASETLRGGRSRDLLDGEGGDDVLLAMRDNDILRGGDGNDRLEGGTYDDLLRGGDGNDVLIAGSGNDRSRGGAGDDVVNGGTGNDRVDGEDGDDRLDGGDGDDTLSDSSGVNLVYGGAGIDRFNRGFNNATASARHCACTACQWFHGATMPLYSLKSTSVRS